ncbi:pyrroline-5-carboxylate reductase [Arenicella xantha]|uniref:Pyrroline-5-carboxylate reductase n=2 Tax=Arenicella xantha TaxID=644221 RepID=A0A395JL45_9GAMM|nr:pyrroline-5-carboxylate reductase [Arenicella xantha]
MASSLIGGLIENGLAASHLYVYDPNQAKVENLAAELGLHACSSNAEVIENSQIVVLAIKPQIMQQVVLPLAASFAQSKPLIMSVVAGIRVSSIQHWLEYNHAVVRVMPNTPALVGCGASGLFASTSVTESQKDEAEKLMQAVGICEWVEQEADIDAVTALSGSGPAYFMLFIECLVNAASKAGLDRDSALRLAVQTAAGAAELISRSDEPLSTLIDNVTSPGGTTEQALLAFEGAQLQDIVSHAFAAAKNRSEQLANELA